MAESGSLSNPSKPWSAYVHEDYIPTVLEAQELSKVEDPENEPFKSKYSAIEKLSNLRHQGSAYSRAEGLLSSEEKVSEVLHRLSLVVPADVNTFSEFSSLQTVRSSYNLRPVF